jgi:hypothetical protein
MPAIQDGAEDRIGLGRMNSTPSRLQWTAPTTSLRTTTSLANASIQRKFELFVVLRERFGRIIIRKSSRDNVLRTLFVGFTGGNDVYSDG